MTDRFMVGIAIILGGLIVLGIIFYLLWDKFD